MRTFFSSQLRVTNPHRLPPPNWASAQFVAPKQWLPRRTCPNLCPSAKSADSSSVCPRFAPVRIRADSIRASTACRPYLFCLARRRGFSQSAMQSPPMKDSQHLVAAPLQFVIHPHDLAQPSHRVHRRPHGGQMGTRLSGQCQQWKNANLVRHPAELGRRPPVKFLAQQIGIEEEQMRTNRQPEGASSKRQRRQFPSHIPAGFESLFVIRQKPVQRGPPVLVKLVRAAMITPNPIFRTRPDLGHQRRPNLVEPPPDVRAAAAINRIHRDPAQARRGQLRDEARRPAAAIKHPPGEITSRQTKHELILLSGAAPRHDLVDRDAHGPILPEPPRIFQPPPLSSPPLPIAASMPIPNGEANGLPRRFPVQVK